MTEEDYYDQGMTEFAMAEYEKAIECYRKAVELDPDNVSLLTRARFSLLGNCRVSS